MAHSWQRGAAVGAEVDSGGAWPATVKIDHRTGFAFGNELS